MSKEIKKTELQLEMMKKNIFSIELKLKKMENKNPTNNNRTRSVTPPGIQKLFQKKKPKKSQKNHSHFTKQQRPTRNHLPKTIRKTKTNPQRHRHNLVAIATSPHHRR